MKILLLDSNEKDSGTMVESLADAKILTNIVVAASILEANKQIRNLSKYDMLIVNIDDDVIDLNILKPSLLSGVAKSHVALIGVSNSKLDEAIIKHHDIKADCYIEKPIDFSQFCKIVQALPDIWFSLGKQESAGTP